MITKFLKDLSPGQTYAIRVKAVRADGQASDWSQVFKLTAVGDSIPPKPITGLNWAAVGTSFVAKWTAPTENTNNTVLKDLKDYKVVITRGLVNRTFYVVDPAFEFTQSMNFDLFGELAYTLDISVQARDQSGNFSTAVTANAVQDTPPVPSTPIVGNLNGLITVKWDGNTATGTRNPISVEHVEIHASTTSNFTPSESTEVGRFNGVFPTPQTTTITGFAYGATVYVRLVAVNRTGRKSNPSAQASGVPTRISGLDIQDGQIGVQQINFTAFDIGGANAYYQTTAPTGSTIKNGDVWYDTDDGYKAYKRTGGSWVLDSNIGVISGTKILAGTLTSNAVGTNLLITASANIGNAVIDSTNIGSVNAGTITVGTLQSSATVTYGGGSSRPTWSFNTSGDGELNNINVRGQLVIGNALDTAAVQAASIVRSYDYVAATSGWAIKGDGTVEFNNGTFRGSLIGATISGGTITATTISTATTGRRLELLTGTGSGKINFIAADGTLAVITAFSSNTDSSGLSENLLLQSPISGTWPGWNGFQIQGNQSTYSHSTLFKVVFGGGSGAELFAVAYASDKGNATTYPTVSDRLVISSTTTTNTNTNFTANISGTTTFQSGTYTTIKNMSQAFDVVDVPSIKFYPKGPINGAEAGYIEIKRTEPGFGSTTSSAHVKFLSPPNSGSVYGVSLKMNYTASPPSNLRLEVRNVTDNGYSEIWASAFPVSSDMNLKKEIRSVQSGTMMDKVRSFGQPKTFRRKTAGERLQSRRELGMLAQDMPEDVVIDGGENAGLAIDHFAVTTAVVGALQEMIPMIEDMKEEIRRLKNE